MKLRNLFLAALVLSVLAAPRPADAQQPKKIQKIGFLTLRSGPSSREEAFRQGLRERGYIEGRNITIEYRFAAGKEERLADLAAELVRLNVDILVAAATPPIQAAKNATRTIPIVMAAAADPVATGLVTSLARPGENVTGLTIMSPELSGKRLELLKGAVPQISRVALFAYQASLATTLFVKEAEAAARTLGLQVQLHEFRGPEEFERAFSAMTRGRANGLLVQLSPLSFDHRKQIADLATRSRLPAIYEVRDFVDIGGLMAYGPSSPDLYRRAALYVDKILKGAKPADLPVEQPTKFELVINAKTAKALGLTIPHSVLIRADQVIQ